MMIIIIIYTLFIMQLLFVNQPQSIFKENGGSTSLAD